MRRQSWVDNRQIDAGMQYGAGLQRLECNGLLWQDYIGWKGSSERSQELATDYYANRTKRRSLQYPMSNPLYPLSFESFEFLRIPHFQRLFSIKPQSSGHYRPVTSLLSRMDAIRQAWKLLLDQVTSSVALFDLNASLTFLEALSLDSLDRFY
jgi:hypothetical protein